MSIIGEKVRLFNGDVVRVLTLACHPTEEYFAEFYALVEHDDGRLETRSLDGAHVLGPCLESVRGCVGYRGHRGAHGNVAPRRPEDEQ